MTEALAWPAPFGLVPAGLVPATPSLGVALPRAEDRDPSALLQALIGRPKKGDGWILPAWNAS
jgi:hypothetical protein